MMLVIPYTDDRANGYELRYAIRSMVNHFKDKSGVCLIGDKPDWYTGEHISHKESHRRPVRRVYEKILQSPYDRFLLSNDDIFATRPFDSLLPLYHDGLLSDKKMIGNYGLRRKNTMQIYPNGMNYDIHVPMVVSMLAFKDACSVDWNKQEYLYRSLYGNYMGVGEYMADNKKPPQDLTMPFFSTNGRDARKLPLSEMYPDKSEYEK